MGINLSGLDLSNVEARAPMDAIPAGWQNCIITNTEMKPTSDGSGQYMELVSEVSDGQYKGRKLFDRLNLMNNNATTVEIAYKTLKAIYNACGKVRVNDSAELHGIPLKVKVKLRPTRTDEATGKTYEASNEVGGYDHISSDHSTGTGSSLAGGVAGAPSGTPAWAAGQPGGTAGPATGGVATGGPANGPAATAGAQPWQPPSGGQPWDNAGPAGGAPATPGASAVAGPAATVQPVLTLTATAQQGGLTLDDYRTRGWTDATLVAHGHAQWVTPAGPAFGNTAAGGAPLPPGGPVGPAAATGAPGGASPPWAR